MASRVIGITGGMGAGKTTLADRLVKKVGATLVSIDTIRRTIGGSDPDHFEALWEKVSESTRTEAQRQVQAAEGLVVLEWARLIEDGYLDMVDGVIVVHCNDIERMARLQGGDLSNAQIDARLKRQMPTSEIITLLEQYGKPYQLVDTTAGLIDDNIEKAYELCADDYDPATSFCLFRIPRHGGRVIWEITNTCNYGCRYCIFSSTSRPQADELSTAKIYETIDGLKECGFTHLKITGGEPFTRPDLMDILKYARQQNFRTDLSTNAAFITAEVVQELASLKLDMVHVSLDGHTQELQEAIRGKRTYTPTINGLKHLVDNGIYVRIGCVLYRNNQNEMRAITEFCFELGCNEVIYSLMEPVGRMRNRPAMLCDRPISEMKAEIEALRAEFSGRIKVNGNFAETVKEGCGACPGGERFLFIDHKGRISPCTWVAERRPTYIAEKTLHDHTLREILEDRENTSFRHLVTGLTRSGLDRCPMQIVPQFAEAEFIASLFEGDLIANLQRGGRYSKASPVYAFATENIGGYLNFLDFSGKDVLTVGASGDQLINVCMAGAKSVVNFDVNLLAKYMAELKLAALHTFGISEFQNFLLLMEHDRYQICRDGLSLSARYFFDSAYKFFNMDGSAMRHSALFRKQQSGERIALNNPYLANIDAYAKAQTACHKLEVKWNTLTAEEMAQTEDSYDTILLSNLSDYAHHMYDSDYLEEFRSKIVTPMAKRLRPGGQMILGYVFDAYNMNGSNVRSRINDSEARHKAFGHYADGVYTEIEIQSAWEDNNKDIILLWEKKA